MNKKQRILWSDDGTMIDLSVQLNDFRSGSSVIDFVAAEDAIYIGTELPFNSRYFKVSAANAIASVFSVSVWDGSAWIATKDLIDQTQASANGKALSQSGQVSFELDIDNRSWGCERVSSGVTGLSGTTIYNMYWSKWTLSADVTSTTALSYIGSMYSTDTELFGFYPDLNNSDLLASFQTGKTDWTEQAFAAADAIEMELRRRSIIVRREQVFDWSLLKPAAIRKTAEIIYGGLGSAYADAKKAASEEFSTALNLKYFETDMNGDGVQSGAEKRFSQAYLTR